MTKKKQGPKKPTVAEICAKIGITPQTFWKRKHEGRDPLAPPLLGSARARNALKHSPWRQGFVLRGSIANKQENKP